MIERLLTGSTMCTSACIVAMIAWTPAMAQARDAASNWAEIERCGALVRDKDRHSCMDAVLERAGVLASAEKRSEAAVAENRETFGLTRTQRETAAVKGTAAAQPAAAPPVSAPAQVAPDAPVVSAPVQPPVVAAAPVTAAPAPPPPPQPTAPAKTVDGIATSIAKAFDPGNRLMIFVTAEGQIWQQSELKDIGLPPRTGTPFTIEKSALGGFMCQVGKYKTFRCTRRA
ncbi:hypothetical protein [Sphingobium nicotianae]|uniref:Uncharacterized protein n=1 Tax=Sphingobium nicotianae TaxID=2782607 RepID=A0A9X1ISE7_9SPHN|nr:hypothetical protein [Sphingobium nicotianae]MBT2188337.1 hypothetical protein [Sphingobium nicotianae]